MLRVILSLTGIAGAGAVGWIALKYFQLFLLPWLKAPSTTHTVWVFGALKFTGWQLWIPFALIAVLAVGILWGCLALCRAPADAPPGDRSPRDSK